MFQGVTVRLSSIFLCAALLLSCARTEEKDMAKSLVKPVVHRMSECTEYAAYYYINGKQVTTKKAALLYNETLYLSLESLQEMVSEQFLRVDEDEIRIRHAVIELDRAIQVENTLYLPETLLSGTYLHINQDVLKTGGPIYLDTHLPYSISYQHDVYEKTDENRNVSSFFLKRYTILESGRRLWKDGKSIWVEDDWGKAYRYRLVEYGL